MRRLGSKLTRPRNSGFNFDEPSLINSIDLVLQDDRWKDVLQYHLRSDAIPRMVAQNIQDVHCRMLEIGDHFRQVQAQLTVMKFEQLRLQDHSSSTSDIEVMESDWIILTQVCLTLV